MGENTDIARSLHYAQLAAQSYLYASGTQYAGTLDRFYFYYTLHGHDLRLWYTPFVCISVLSLEEYADDPDRVY